MMTYRRSCFTLFFQGKQLLFFYKNKRFTIVTLAARKQLLSNGITLNAARRIIARFIFIYTKKPTRKSCGLTSNISRYLAESNCSTRFCRPLPNRSAKVPCSCLRVQRYYIFFIPPNFFYTFFRITSYFLLTPYYIYKGSSVK